jgi:hypothetical protein
MDVEMVFNDLGEITAWGFTIIGDLVLSQKLTWVTIQQLGENEPVVFVPVREILGYCLIVSPPLMDISVNK